MKIQTEYPPNYEEICKKFPEVRGKKNVVFTYGDTFYNPNGEPPSKDLVVHESVHVRQQTNGWLSGGARRWWKKYFTDPEFRLGQELEAYRVQYKFAKENLKDRNELNKFLIRISRDLSSPVYGEIITFDEAYKKISRP